MSIYATIGQFKIKRNGDNEYREIFIQAVPPHIDGVGPAFEHLPPPVDPEGKLFRAVFVVEAGEPKGTERSSQEYRNFLLKFTGQEYHDIRFVDFMFRLEAALDARYRMPESKSKIGPEAGRSYVD